jgi:cytochrome c553
MTCPRTANPACQLAALAALALLGCLLPGHATADHARCIACHGADGMGYGNFSIPIIAGIPTVHIEEALFAYKDGARQCLHAPLMCETASSISDEEIAEVADYFGAQERVSSEQSYDADKAAEGKLVHERLCKGCHVPPDDSDVADAVGIPLHGQRRLYLRYALDSYMDGSRENLLPAMENKLSMLQDGDIEALTNYYSSF